MQEYENFEPLKVFLEICAIPHPSFKTQVLKEWIINEATKTGAKVQCDTIGNVLCAKGIPKLCLQGHYDMVYVGESAKFQVKPKFTRRGNKAFLCAENSSLGADNGAALACMLLALRDFANIECLFSIDEEVGMLGARDIALPLHSSYMLNCDSEEIDEVVCSCAGGYDLECKVSIESFAIPQDCELVEIRTQGFVGGHSGIEIHKNIPNAILELAKIAKPLVDYGALIVEFSGGEKRNSIPVNAMLQIAIPQAKHTQCKRILEEISQKPLKDSAHFVLSTFDAKDKRCFNASKVIEAILNLQNGVMATSDNEPILSSNLGILRQTMGDKEVQIHFIAMGRGNQESLMQENITQEKDRLEALGFAVELSDYYAPWEKEESELLNIVWEVMQVKNPKVKLKSIHAGLECGILKQKYPKVCFVSIGPSISHPHSIYEELDLESFVQFNGILREVLKRFQAI
ncbi:M20/M25/M40 family metallo-hydrolase [uncultured Helicobacter sp.]|uniref:M20/M25/M40 family metallo-hydrolase n=1 Tax=uncultured Helicobacter sp. TaxID=175537 RepID=UPI00262F7551|nr:M20/M25/M40 family metallo-hydrolase [uncultured Helicobacter sp.]